MNEVLEIKFSGWTATPRLPFVISGNALCMPVPSYSIILGIIGCCLGRNVSPSEVKVGYRYSYDTVAEDVESRRRLKLEGKKIKSHHKGGDAYKREFHVNPVLTIWIDRIDWLEYFESPIGTPTLGRSQDLLMINSVLIKKVEKIEKAGISGCMLPYQHGILIPGQLLQIAEAYEEGESIGSGRIPINSSVFIAIYPDSTPEISIQNLYQTLEDDNVTFYLHTFNAG